MGCHIYSPPYRALALTRPIEVTAYGPAPSAESWATRAHVKLTYPGTDYTAGKTIICGHTDGGEMPPDALRERAWERVSRAGQHFVGTGGLLVLPHMSADPFVIADAGTPTLPQIEIPDRDHYGEFVDAVLAGGRKPCSAGFDYAGPLTESVLLGNVAAHFPNEPLEFDASALRFPKKPDADQHLSRTYRAGWRIKT